MVARTGAAALRRGFRRRNGRELIVSIARRIVPLSLHAFSMHANGNLPTQACFACSILILQHQYRG